MSLNKSYNWARLADCVGGKVAVTRAAPRGLALAWGKAWLQDPVSRPAKGENRISRVPSISGWLWNTAAEFFRFTWTRGGKCRFAFLPPPGLRSFCESKPSLLFLTKWKQHFQTQVANFCPAEARKQTVNTTGPAFLKERVHVSVGCFVPFPNLVCISPFLCFPDRPRVLEARIKTTCPGSRHKNDF